jgi:mRNA-degrading endonuclease RelE of RelBE toxin-antitoxin system
MPFTLVVELRAVAVARSMLPAVLRPIGEAIDKLRIQPRPDGFVRLRPAGACRITVHGHRILYVVDDEKRAVHVLDVTEIDLAYEPPR